ncbi:hypothetical protein ElyMa_003719300 [Elysia marginata]|uniref:Uncharacterized protein n=1 Tax=Elysia marginata TaxID=1093978 RepID=A0AAV4F4N3_9GAST|nr:hypothetical protein ElyMa_003719300 [Elysia marginata]
MHPQVCIGLIPTVAASLTPSRSTVSSTSATSTGLRHASSQRKRSMRKRDGLHLNLPVNTLCLQIPSMIQSSPTTSTSPRSSSCSI